jgi:hypothetical protein
MPWKSINKYSKSQEYLLLARKEWKLSLVCEKKTPVFFSRTPEKTLREELTNYLRYLLIFFASVSGLET